MLKTTRRDFCGLTALVGAGAAFALSGGRVLSAQSEAPKAGRWYKGALHTHTYWSDGRGFPEDCVKAYKDIGWDFVCITDHNRIGAGADFWRDVEPDDGPWPPNVSRAVFDHYVKAFPHARTRVGANGKVQVRLQPVDETIRMFSEDDAFLVMKGVEITRSISGANRRDIHSNYLNLPEVIPDVAKDWLIADRPNVPIVDLIRNDYAACRALAAKHGNPPSLFMVNHPHWPCLDVTAQDLLSCPEVRFFEICNGGADFPVPSEMPDDGWENDRLWDAVNAIRARRGERLLYATGSDDAHWYPGNGHDRKTRTTCTPGDAWVCVRADSLTPSALFGAMDRGDFYASCGVELGDVRFDGRSLAVSVPAKTGVAYRIRFIVSKRDFDEKNVHTVRVAFPSGSDPKGRRRDVSVYGPDVGRTAKLVSGASGRALSAAYALQDDDLYVRARIESDEPGFVTASFHPKNACAWTQPYGKQ